MPFKCPDVDVLEDPIMLAIRVELLAAHFYGKEREATFMSISRRSSSERDCMKVGIIVPFFIVLQLDEVVCVSTSMNKYTISHATQKSFMHNFVINYHNFLSMPTKLSFLFMYAQ